MKTMKVFLIALLTALLLAGSAFADVISGPMYAMVIGLPLLTIVVILLIAVLVIRSVVRAAKQKRDSESRPDGTAADRKRNREDPWN